MLSVVGVGAANICIRDGGSGDGSAWNNALDDLPSSLTRGNTYYIADGTYAGYDFDDTESSTTVITIKKATVADHGTSTGWLDSYGDGMATWGNLVFSRDYFVFDGAFRNESQWDQQNSYGFRVGRVTAWPINFPPGGDHVTLRYCDIGGAYSETVWDEDETAVYLVNNSGLTTDWTITRCYLHNTEVLTYLLNINDYTITYNYYGNGWGKEAIRGAEDVGDGTIAYNLFRDSTQDAGGGGEASTAPIAMWGATGSGFYDNIKVYGNVFWDTIALDTPHTGGVIVLGGDGGGWLGSAANNCLVYNNTTVNHINFAAGILINGGTGNEARNNLWYNCVGTPVADGDNLTQSNNGEASSDPFVNAASFNFHLSAAISGTSLSSPYNVDLDGATRGADGTFDRGAYEFSAGGGGSSSYSVSVGGSATVGGNVTFK